MLKERDRIIGLLASKFLDHRDLDEGYFDILEDIEQLRSEKIFVDISEVQGLAYQREEVR